MSSRRCSTWSTPRGAQAGPRARSTSRAPSTRRDCAGAVRRRAVPLHARRSAGAVVLGGAVPRMRDALARTERRIRGAIRSVPRPACALDLGRVRRELHARAAACAIPRPGASADRAHAARTRTNAGASRQLAAHARASSILACANAARACSSRATQRVEAKRPRRWRTSCQRASRYRAREALLAGFSNASSRGRCARVRYASCSFARIAAQRCGPAGSRRR